VISSEIIYEDEYSLAFLDIHPRAPGHSVIIPKKHASSILDLEDGMIEPIFLTVKHVSAILNTSLHPDGFTIGINHGRISGQTVDHLHVHVIPRFNDDGGTSIHSVVNNPPEESLSQIAIKIRKQ
jgi:histidine triad (HIT) family protein